MLEEFPRKNPEKELDPKWKETMREAIETAPYYAMEVESDRPIDLSPFSISGKYEEGWEDISRTKNHFIAYKLFEVLGIDQNKDEPIETFSEVSTVKHYPEKQQNWMGIRTTRIFGTDFDNVYLYEESVTGQKGIRYFLAGEEFNLE